MVSAFFLAPADDGIGDRTADGYPDKPRSNPRMMLEISHPKLTRLSSSGAAIEVALADDEAVAT
jgi:hypothetical protein